LNHCPKSLRLTYNYDSNRRLRSREEELA